MSREDPSTTSLLDLFRIEAETHTGTLTAGLLALERDPSAPDQLEACMRAAHSLKGAARIVNVPLVGSLAHAMEDCFVAAQAGKVVLARSHIDSLLAGVDWLTRFCKLTEGELDRDQTGRGAEVDALIAALRRAIEGEPLQPVPEPAPEPPQREPAAASDPHEQPHTPAPSPKAILPAPAAPVEHVRGIKTLPTAAAASADSRRSESTDRVLRVTAENLNRLLGLSGELLVESRWLRPFGQSLLRLKRQQHELGGKLCQLRDVLADLKAAGAAEQSLSEALAVAQACQQSLAAHLSELDLFDRRSTNLSRRLYDEAVACRMRPFADGVRGFPRMVRDLARSLKKEVRFHIRGESTPVDRDILEKLEAPLNHLLRNALDHGIETPEERQAVGKAAEGTVVLEASHRGGMLLLTVQDDGRGIDLERLRAAVVRKRHTNEDTAGRLTESELLEFLFLPGFSMSESVSEISGRGVGLDVVKDMARQVRGNVRVSLEPGKGTRFQMQLPLTLSVVRALLIEVAGEPYALPLAYIVRTVKVPRQAIESLEGRQHFPFEGSRVGLVSAHQVLDRPDSKSPGEELPVVVLGDHQRLYGLAVDGFLGGRELVVHSLDPRLGKIKDVSAGSLLEDGTPVVILDAEDLAHSIDKLVTGGHLSAVKPGGAPVAQRRKRILVVDDSLTVRELERKLLAGQGYDVEVAVNGVDGWNVVRAGHFDLLITDVDMPRMDGIELLTRVKQDSVLKALPVMIVSYKDREEDRQRGLEAGADYYLTKGSFHDETLLQAVADLIGGRANENWDCQ